MDKTESIEAGKPIIIWRVDIVSAVRQPVNGWPRLRRNESWEGRVQFTRL